MNEIDCIAIDDDASLYWQGQRVVTSARLDLDRWQMLIAVVAAVQGGGIAGN